jgi:hypothetical protein
MILDQGRRHDDSPSLIIAVKEIENTSSFCRITRRQFEPIALDRVFNGFRAEVDLGPGLRRQLQYDIRVARVSRGILTQTLFSRYRPCKLVARHPEQ